MALDAPAEMCHLYAFSTCSHRKGNSRAVDTNVHGVAAAQAIANLWAITGNVDIPGGCIMPSTGYTTNDFEFAMVGIGPDYTKPDPDNQLYDGWEEYPLRTIMPASLGDKTLEDIENGPWEISEGKWQYDFIPAPTNVCDLCADRTAAGKMPSCVQHCQANVITVGPLDELEKLAVKGRMVIYVR